MSRPCPFTLSVHRQNRQRGLHRDGLDQILEDFLERSDSNSVLENGGCTETISEYTPLRPRPRSWRSRSSRRCPTHPILLTWHLPSIFSSPSQEFVGRSLNFGQNDNFFLFIYYSSKGYNIHNSLFPTAQVT